VKLRLRGKKFRTPDSNSGTKNTWTPDSRTYCVLKDDYSNYMYCYKVAQ